MRCKNLNEMIFKKKQHAFQHRSCKIKLTLIVKIGSIYSKYLLLLLKKFTLFSCILVLLIKIDQSKLTDHEIKDGSLESLLLATVQAI